MKNQYTLLLGMDMPFRERAFAAALRVSDNRVASIQKFDSPVSGRWADILLHGDPQKPGILGLVRDFERRSGMRPGAVVPLGEFTLEPGAEIAEYYGLPYLQRSSLNKCRNKIEMRKQLSSFGLKTPKFAEVYSKDTLEQAANHVGFPLVIKPSNLGTSVGVRLVERPDQLVGAYEDAISASSQYATTKGVQIGRLHVEEFIECEQEVVALVQNSATSRRCFAVAETFLSDPPHFAEIGHRLPFVGEAEQKVRDIAEQACLAMSISLGIAHVDIRIKPDGTPIVVEVGARPPGNGLMDLAEKALGSNFFEHHIRSYYDQDTLDECELSTRISTSIFFLKAGGGIIKRMEPPELPPGSTVFDRFSSVGDFSLPLLADGNAREGALEFAVDGSNIDVPRQLASARAFAKDCFVLE